jgi:hypothetical protein
VYDCSRFVHQGHEENDHGLEIAVASGLALRSHSKVA